MTALAVCLAKGMAFYCPVELSFRAFGALLALQPCSGMLPGLFLLKMPLNTPNFKDSQQSIYYLDSIKLGGIREHFDLALHARAHVDRVHPNEQPTLGARNGSKNMGIILLHTVRQIVSITASSTTIFFSCNRSFSCIRSKHGDTANGRLCLQE